MMRGVGGVRKSIHQSALQPEEMTSKGTRVSYMYYR